MKWNDQNWYYIIDDLISANFLTSKCKDILLKDQQKRAHRREITKTLSARIMRNIKRRNARINNKISLKGHLYANDKKRLNMQIQQERLHY